MINLTKRLTLAVLVIVFALLFITVLTKFDERTGPPVEPNAASSSAMSTTASIPSTLPKSTSLSSSGERAPIAMGFSQDVNLLFATTSVTLNYSITISQLETAASQITVSASSTVPGVTLTVDPREFTFLGTQQEVTLGISVDPRVNSSILPVQVVASSAGWKTNSTFDFILDKALIVVLPTGHLAPPTMNVGVGQKVTWLDLIGTQNSDPVDANIALVDSSAASPTMGLDDVWSHTFDKPGTYPYRVTLTGSPTASGVVIVA